MNEIFLSSSHMVFYITLAQSEWKNIIAKARNEGTRAVLILNSLDMRTNTKHLCIICEGDLRTFQGSDSQALSDLSVERQT